MRGAVDTILSATGKTPIVKLQRIGAELEAEIYVKCEFLQPSGSGKDRVARRMIDAAEASGALTAGGTIVEATTGNMGAALAAVAAVRGYKCAFVVSDRASAEKVAALRAYGAKVIVAPSALPPDDPKSVRSVAHKLAESTPGAWLVDQYQNELNPHGHSSVTGAEIWDQVGDELDVVVAGIGSGGTITGVGRYLKAKKRGITIVGVDPVGSIVHGFVQQGRVIPPSAYELEGIGVDFFPRTLDAGVLDDVVQVEDGEAFRMARDLVRSEGLFVGGSSGAAVAGAVAWAKRAGGARRVLVLLPDGAGGYLSKIFNDEWMREHGFLDRRSGLGTVRDLLGEKGNETVITAKSTDRVRDVIARMKSHGISQLPVVKDDALIGAVTEVDLLRYLVSGESSLDGEVEPLALSEYATVASDLGIERLQGTLSDTRMAVVMDDDRVVGVVTKIDLIEYLARRAL
ncbi:MAG: pyridoxal-phosphate dependent enzyme [Sandaracinaceae bacterium]